MSFIFFIHAISASGCSAEDLHSAQVLLQEAIEMRRRYMKMSKQRFSPDCEEFIDRGVTSTRDKKRARGLSVGVSLLDHQVPEPLIGKH